MINAMEGKATLAMELARMEHEHHHHHDHHHHEDDECCCHEEHEHHHHHHEDDECCCHEEHEHHHHHHEDGECCCHDHDHHADEVFSSWGVETSKKFDRNTVVNALHELDTGKYGMVLRAKGIIPANDGTWIHFDMVPEEIDIRTGRADINGKICVIGSKLDEAGIAGLFEV